ncbi:MAG: hypothetical protein EBU79_09545, partial [Betaproteobacteria bacterium]|nr:hypothetical protein [Betaproteobacteria bacterium]
MQCTFASHGDLQNTKSRLAKRLRERQRLVNVLDYGADATGSSSSTTAIQNAITAAIASGQNVFFPSGNYVWDAATAYTIQPSVGKGLTLFGEGASSLITVKDNNTT